MNSPSAERRPRKLNLPVARQILRLVLPYKWTFIAALAALAVGSTINLFFPEMLREALNSDSVALILGHPWSAAGLLLAIFAVQAVSFYVRALLFVNIGQQIVADLRSKLYQAILMKPVEFYDAHRSGDLVSRLNLDTAQIQDAVSIKLSVLIRYGLQVLVGVALMAYLSPRLTVVLVLGLPVLIGLSMLLGKKLRAASRAQQTALGVLTATAEETFIGNRIVKAFGREALELSRFDQANKLALLHGLTRSRIAAFFASFVNFLMNAFLVVVVLFGLTLVSSSQLSVGDLTAFLLYAAIVAVSFAFFIGAYTEFVQAVGGAERVFDLLAGSTLTELPVEQQPSSNPVAISFEHVSFAYPTRPENQVLDDLSFSLTPGSSTAIVGPSGAGKSSLIALLLGFYAPSKGKISVDGKTLSEEEIPEARAKMGYVPQDAFLFGVSLADNLRYGRSSIDTETLMQVCRNLALDELVRSLPQGLETFPGDRGVQLSGGQRQRFALARAILRDPGLLILDEATSSLDSETEHVVQEFLKTKLKGRTSIVIAHRLSTVKSVDRILVLDRGRIVQLGSHEELSRTPGLYRSLVERQELISN